MAKLELWHPCNPYIETQAWGLYNPAYQQFGFSRHNGRDFLLGSDKKLYAPIRARVTWVVDQIGGAGVHFIMNTLEKYDFPDGVSCYVEITLMHCEKILVSVGQEVAVGDVLAIADNTGFSTGPHTHMRCRRIRDDGTLIDNNDANGSFDHAPYFNGYSAQLGGLARMAIQLAKLVIESIKKSRGVV